MADEDDVSEFGDIYLSDDQPSSSNENCGRDANLPNKSQNTHENIIHKHEWS